MTKIKKLWIVLFLIISANLLAQTVRFNRDVNLPFNIAASGPLLPDMDTQALSPSVQSVGAVEETLWSENNLYQFLSVATTLSVASSDVDDNSAGTGLRTIQVTCLTDTYLEFKETVILNGQTEVAMSAQCFRVQGNGMLGLTAGSSGSNEGTIYIGDGTFTAGVPANVRGVIDPTDNISRFGVYTVPANKSLLVTQFAISTSEAKNTVFVVVTKKENGLSIRAIEFTVNANILSLSNSAPIRVDEKTDIELRATTLEGDGDVKALFGFIVGVGI